MEQGLAGGQAQAAVCSGIEQAVGAPGHHGLGGGQEQAAFHDERRLQMVGSDAMDELCQVLLSELAAALPAPAGARQGGGEVAGDMGCSSQWGQKDGRGMSWQRVSSRAAKRWRQCPSNWARTSNMSPRHSRQRIDGGRLFHGPLDDEVEPGGLLPGVLHRLARAKVADAEVLTEPLACLLVQAVERWTGQNWK